MMINKFNGKILALSLLIFAFLVFQASSVFSATISGNVKIDGKKDKSGVLITILGRNLSGITDIDGNYSIKNVPSGPYTITAQKPGNLTSIRSDVKVENDIVVDFQLTPGDLKIDNQINLLDRIILTSVWKSKKGDSNWNPMMDIYEDGIIDEKDRDLLLANWRKGNPNIKLGSLSIEQTNPPSASILINGADTGKKAPYTFTGMIVGEYIITLKLSDYTPKDEKVKISENQVASISSESRVFDNQSPEFADWTTTPVELTEDTQGNLVITVKITDKSGLGNNIPQFDYHIGANTSYSGYKQMKPLGNDMWSFEIVEPAEKWDTYRGKYIYYKSKAEDATGNSGESKEQQKMIISINDPPIVRIVNTFTQWQKGLITITAEASDSDGNINDVLFEYSFDNINWLPIDSAVVKTPYSVSWDTKSVVKDVMKNVWLRATATDNENASVKYFIPNSFGIDNQAPTTSHDYDGLWHKADFPINLKASDGNGIGVAIISYRLNNGNKQDVEVDGQAVVPVIISKEDLSNILEYWSYDKLGNEEQHKTLSNIKLDKTAPIFSNWQQEPADLTEDTKGSFRVFVQVADSGSGLTGKLPQIDYRIGTDTQYTGYKNMATNDGKVWYFDIIEPVETWDAFRGKYLYYKVRCEDVAGNIGESSERAEPIDNINDPPSIKILSAFNPWNKGVIRIEASASDKDGSITEVRFEYSLNKIDWRPIGASIAIPPYTIGWDTTAVIQQNPAIWIRSTAIDNNGDSSFDIYLTSIGIDNQPPITNDDYNDLWHKEDFAIVLSASDGNGIGVDNKDIRYKLNNGEERNVQSNGQPKITIEGIHQLEYWSIDKIGNTEAHRTIQNIRLDKTPPSFSDWVKDPVNLTEDSVGTFIISVRVTDSAGSGMTGKIPKISYHIGKETNYGEYVNMMGGAARDVWYYEIPEPSGKWDSYRGKTLYYKVTAEDIAGNKSESSEQQELIDDINDAPTVKILTSFNQWEKGQLKIDVEALDTDGTITTVEFDYSFNKVDWNRIGAVTTFPYSITWYTKQAIPQVEQVVWIRAIAIDDDKDPSKEHIVPNSFKIDNEPPTASHTYDSQWKNADFIINLTANDKNGVGIQSISYQLNNNPKQTVSTNGQAGVPVSIINEGSNTLAYWATDRLGNEETQRVLTNIYLDKTLPSFSNWEQTPSNVTEDTKGSLTVSLKITDNGSGISGKIAQFDYHIGTDTRYEGYKNMTSQDGITWSYEIPEPTDTWNTYLGKNIYYKVKISDIAGNTAESQEQKELIDSINDPPVVKLLTVFKDWETNDMTISAEASDIDGSVPIVQFEYSLDSTKWQPISEPDDTPPYSVMWNTRVAVPEIAKSVWVRAIATDADDRTVTTKSEVSRKFGIDNQPPKAGDWTKTPENLTEDTKDPFKVTVDYSDGEGSGIIKVEIAYKIGTGSYTDFREMRFQSNNTWYYNIIESGGWDRYRGQTIYYKSRATDAVGNISPDSPEQQELIDDINDPPTGEIKLTHKDWERGNIVIQATATDQDGEVKSVQFQYSLNNSTWVNIGGPIIRSPYTITWDSSEISVAPEVWTKALVTDDDNETAEVLITKTFGIDNKPPEFSNWRLTPVDLTESSTEPFLRVEVDILDNASGLDQTKIQINYSIGKNKYVGYQNMYRETGNTWFFEIQPLGSKWSNYAGQEVYYKVKATDKAGNTIESEEFKELIDPTTGIVTGTITPRESWRVARVAVLRNSQMITEIAVSQINGSYNISNLTVGLYDLQVNAPGFGIDNSQKNVEIKVGQVKTIPNIELLTYSVEDIVASQGGKVEYRDSDLKTYKLEIDSNALIQNSKVILGFGGNEPTGVPNPVVSFLGKAIGVGYQFRDINRQLRLILPRPAGITESKNILAYIYDGKDYRLIDRNDIATNDSTVTVLIKPSDVRNFNDQNHRFDKVLNRITDTAFYVFIAKLNEPSVNPNDIGIRDPQIVSGKVTGYIQPNIAPSSKKIVVVMHGIASKLDDLTGIINELRILKQTNGVSNYYDNVLVFNYDAGTKSIITNGSTFTSEINRILPPTFDGTIDVIAHDTGGLVARYAIANLGMDMRIGSLIILATPNDGINLDLLKNGFNSFLKKSQSDPVWSFYNLGWQEALEGSQVLSSLNSRFGKKVNTHYYAIGASNPGAVNETENEDGLMYLRSINIENSSVFPLFEGTLSKRFEKVDVIELPFEGTGFLSKTRHLSMLLSIDVRNKITSYLRGKSENIKIDRNDIDLIPGNRIDKFNVVLKNTGNETIYGVSAQLSTTNTYIRKYNGQQGIESNLANYGDIPAGQTATKSFSFDVSSSATSAIGQQVIFNLLIRNSKDNSISLLEFSAPIGGNLVRIALNPQTQAKLINIDANKDTARPSNDSDIALEPGEILNINISLENRSASAMQTVKAILKTNDLRIKGLVGTTEVNMSTDGLQVDYGTISGSAVVSKNFQFVKLNNDDTLLGQTITFDLDIKSGQNIIGTDKFSINIGSDIIVSKFVPNRQLIPGGTPDDIVVTLKNVTNRDISNVEVRIISSTREVDLQNDRATISLFRSLYTEDVRFLTSIDTGFSGYASFTIEIRVNNNLTNIDARRHYFGMHTHYITDWITDDREGTNSDKIAEPGETVRLMLARRNPTTDIAKDVRAGMELVSTNTSINLIRIAGDYYDIPANSVANARREYEFSITADVTASSPSGSTLTATRLTMFGANWTASAFKGRYLNPNTTSGDPQYWIKIMDNGTDWIEVVSNANLLDPDNNPATKNPQDGNPFQVRALVGIPVEFKLKVSEDGAKLGEESYTTRVGGMVRYQPPNGYDEFLKNISDAVSLSTKNNGNGIPEPGETIELIVMLINTGTINATNVRARLDTTERDVDISYNYDEVDYGSTTSWGSTKRRAGKFRFTIDPYIEVDRVPFELSITGTITGMTGTDLGIDTFFIPIKR